MKMTSTLIASDTIAPLTTIDESTYPQLFSIIFGEGMTNDAVALILMNTIIKLDNDGESDINMDTIVDFSKQFLISSIASIFFGFLMGAISCIIHKSFKSMNEFPILETCFIFLMAILTYTICELPFMKMAAIVAIFIFGVTQNHYNKYNLSTESVEKTGFAFGALGYVCEAFILIYLGLSFDHFDIDTELIVFALVDFSLVFISRVIVTFFLILLMQLITRGKSLSMKKGLLITFGGMIRGAIAYALIVKLSNPEVDHDKFIVTIT